ncbi:isopeptide-forming domain-containing fimbrial protein [Streptococcus sp. ST16]|uniref:isopeptide-forming domain-containing fimbrial protein n=1 Tax=Streptococcus sp. ST16 TaxID=3378283 RepID=UPI0038D40C5B
MKKLKFILAAIVAVVSTFVGGTVKAADNYTITINNPVSGHTYEAYQIFKGDLNDSTLSNIQWGSNISEIGKTTLGAATTKAEELSKVANNSTAARNFATEVSKYLEGNPAGTGTTITGLTAGYYLIKDKDDATSAYILEVVKNVTVTPKVGTPTVQKKVKDTNDTTGVTTDWQDSADYDINDDVPFQLTATLPANYDSYNSYYLNFEDELSSGLTYNNDAKVYVVNGTERKEVTNYFFAGSDNGKLSFAIQDLKQISINGTATINKDSKIVVEYSAKLNSNAVIGSQGNPNSVILKYSNNPNHSGDGNQKPTIPPTTPPTTPPTPPETPGKTPKDTVIVFTYKTVVNKVDQNGAALKGAEFKLFKKMQDGSLKEIATEAPITSDTTSFGFKGLDDGDYILKETKTPAGYNTIKDITFTVTAEHDVLADQPKLTNLSGVAASGQITFTADKDAGSLTTQVENKKGSILPSTGSIGTTVLYVAGSVLVVAAGILLVTKKRMKN